MIFGLCPVSKSSDNDLLGLASVTGGVGTWM